MRRLGLLALLPLTGCLGPDRPSSQWADQIDSALMIPNPQNRVNAVGTLAQTAAYSNEPDSVRYALDQLPPGLKHDQIAAACAAQLAQKDKASARKIAGRIGDATVRADALAKLD